MTQRPTPDEPDDLGPEEVDARFRELTAAFDTSGLGLVDGADGDGEDAPAAGPRAHAAGPRDYAAAEDEGFVEPDPPLEISDPVTVLAWFGLVAGLTGAAIVGLAGGASWIGIACALAALAGLATLLVRLPRQRADDDGGAVV